MSPAADPAHHLQMAPQEVLQELLGDLYVDASRLTIGGYEKAAVLALESIRPAAGGKIGERAIPLACNQGLLLKGDM